MYRKTCQIDTILADLNYSVDAHYDWLVNMFSCVVNNAFEQPDIIYPCAHKHCRVGTWLHHHQPMGEEESSCIQSISEAHMRMHDSGRQMMLAIQNKTVTAEHFTDFKQHLALFSSAVTTYKSYLLNMRSGIDILTGLPGRRMLDETFVQQLIRAPEQNIYLLLLDIDRFKNINDTYGHLIGDSVLRGLAQLLRDGIRDDDNAYRYGGEEFIILLRAPSDKDACLTGLRLCNTIADTTLNCDDQALHITVTVGLTKVQAKESLDEAAKRADAAMYRGKQTGRNRCMFMDEWGEIHHFVG
ncbi:sensor domain-containing diguanylate cyclase [Kosakonia radicincitans DSM 16656]|uniref:diguanylate cyclase n=1 Tax=Kosakonia radicincitans TaxID=283686 RepID=UPI00027300A5|nr:diguanylate cyclase [Kosakonia radicincitans]ARD60250.1 sensor domain-containing diguanylate cyclase [Kosakonia radicincitans DSM 16656]